MADLITPPNVNFHPLDGPQTYMGNLQAIATAINTSIAGYNQQIQAGEDAATALTNCQQALQDTLEASTTHLPLQSGQKNKILMSQGQGGQAYWGGQWTVKTSSFSVAQLDTFIAHATATPIDITLVTPETVGMHVIVRNSLLSTETVKVVLGTETMRGMHDNWAAGDEIELMPGDVFQAICMDTTENSEIWELI